MMQLPRLQAKAKSAPRTGPTTVGAGLWAALHIGALVILLAFAAEKVRADAHLGPDARVTAFWQVVDGHCASAFDDPLGHFTRYPPQPVFGEPAWVATEDTAFVSAFALVDRYGLEVRLGSAGGRTIVICDVFSQTAEDGVGFVESRAEIAAMAAAFEAQAMARPGTSIAGGLRRTPEGQPQVDEFESDAYTFIVTTAVGETTTTFDVDISAIGILSVLSRQFGGT